MKFRYITFSSKLVTPLFLTLILVLLFLTSNSQNNLTPGIGYDSVYIGMELSELTKYIGEPTEAESREVEKKWFNGFGIDTMKSLIFILKWDSVYEFENNNTYGIWKAYAQSDSVVAFNLSGYVFDTTITNYITISSDIKFNDSIEKVKKNSKIKFIENKTREYELELLSLESGTRYIFDEGILRNILVFKPFDAIRTEKTKQILDIE